MNRLRWLVAFFRLLVAGLLSGWLLAGGARADEPPTLATTVAPISDEDFGKKATWQPPAADEVRAQVFQWIQTQSDNEVLHKRAGNDWPSGKPLTGVDLLEQTVHTLALGDAKVRELVDLCRRPRKSLVLPSFAVLTDDHFAPLVRNNLRLWYGRWLAQQRMYDEALVQLSGLDPADVVDPASLLFYQSVVHHFLLHKEEGLRTLDRLMERQKELPRRYAAMTTLMRSDLEALKDESLDHISRRMDDVHRRLDFGRTGKTVRGEEDGIIASLDKLIDDLEKQQQQQQQQSSGGARAPVRPAQDSMPLQGKGPGEVTKKNIGNKSGWGDLPPRERDEAMQQIGKEFPSHYRDIIEQYFRKLAAEEGESK